MKEARRAMTRPARSFGVPVRFLLGRSSGEKRHDKEEAKSCEKNEKSC